MHDTHNRQVQDGVAASLQRAGIGRRYHDRRLIDTAHGPEIAGWLTARENVVRNEAFAIAIAGKSAAAYDTFVLTARSLHMSGVGVMIVGVPDIITALTTYDHAALERIEEAHVLAIRDFYTPDAANDCPFTGAEVRRVENLLNRRLDEDRSFVLEVASPAFLKSQPRWWSARFLDRIASVNQTFEVA